MDINFGVGLRNYLFEQNSPQLQTSIALKIRAQAKLYMPFLNLSKIDFNLSDLQEHRDQILNISIEYSVASLNILDSITVGSTTG